MTSVMMAWVLFRADDFTHAWGYFKSMYSYQSTEGNLDILHIFLNNEIYYVLLLAILSSTRLWVVSFNKLKTALSGNSISYKFASGIWTFFIFSFVIAVMILSTNYLVANSYNPFIYFRF